MRDLNELKLNNAGAPIDTPPPTEQQLALVEQAIGAKLPAAYVAFLRYSNGGHPQLNTFYVDVPSRGYHQQWGINNFFSIASDDPATADTEEVIWRYQHRHERLPRRLLPIADNGLGDELLLDLTKEGDGRVVLLAHQRPAWARRALPAAEVLLPVAKSFEELIDSLAIDPDAEDL